MRWILLLCLSLSLPALADLDYALKPRLIAEDTWLLEGSTDNFAKSNGGNIVNTAFIVTDAGVVVIDTGPSRRYGEAMRQAIAQVTAKPVIQVLLTHHHPDHALGNQAFKDVPIGALADTTRLLHEQGDGMAENLYRMVGDWMRGTEVVLPTQVLEPGVMHFGRHDLRLLALTGHTGEEGFTRGGAVHHGVAHDDVFGSHTAEVQAGAHHHAATRQALAGVVVGVAHQIQGNAIAQEGAKRLAAGALHADVDGVIGQTFGVHLGHRARQHRTHGAVNVAYRLQNFDRLALVDGGA